MVIKSLILLNVMAYVAIAIFVAVYPIVQPQPEGLGFSVEAAALVLACWIFLSIPSAILALIQRRALSFTVFTLALSTLSFPIWFWLLEILLSALAGLFVG